ncbi:MAG: hypothetical protein ACSHW1_15050 [Yoonia sp.]
MMIGDPAVKNLKKRGLGPALVGPYDELRKHVKAAKLGLEADHIFQSEHLRDIKTAYSHGDAIAVAIEPELHKLKSDRVTGAMAEGGELGGGRAGHLPKGFVPVDTPGAGRAIYTIEELSDFYRDLFDDFGMPELGKIADHVANSGSNGPKQGSGASGKSPSTPKASAASRGTADRGTPSPTGDGHLTERGSNNRGSTVDGEAGTGAKGKGGGGTSANAARGVDAPAPLPKARLINGPDVSTLDRLNSFKIGRSKQIKEAMEKAGNAFDKILFDPLDMALKPLRLGFGASLAIGLAVAAIFYVFEKRLAQENRRSTKRGYRHSIFTVMKEDGTGQTLEQLVTGTIDTVWTNDGSFSQLSEDAHKVFTSNRMYAEYNYNIVMEVVNESLADDIVFLLRGFSYVEVYKRMEPVGDVRTYFTKDLIKESKLFTQKRGRAGTDDLVRYRCTHRMLIWDPTVYQRFIDLWNWHMGVRNALSNAQNKMSPDQKRATEPLIKTITQFAIRFQYYEILTFIDGKHPVKNAEQGKVPDDLQKYFKDVSANAKSGDNVIVSAKKMQFDRRGLLIMFAGQDLFEDRKKAKRAERRAKRAKTNPYEEQPRPFGSNEFL